MSPVSPRPPFSSQEFTGDNIRLNQIPSAVYLFISRPRGVRDSANFASYGDYYPPFTNISVQFGNQTGLLSALSEEQIRDLARENGLDLIQDEYYSSGTANQNSIGFKTNMVLKLVFGKDIPLSEFESPGVRGDYNFQINGTFYNPYFDQPYNTTTSGTFYTKLTLPDYNMTLNTLFMLPGRTIIRPQECIVETGILNVGDISGADDVGGKYEMNGVEGGNLDNKVDGPSGFHPLTQDGGSRIGGSRIGGNMNQDPPTIKELVNAYQSRS